MVTISSVCAILVILAFNILKNNTIGAGVGLLMFVFISISYLCGGFQLSSAMGGAKKKDPKIDFIVSSAKKISGVSGLVVLSMLFYAVIRTLKRFSLAMGFLESLGVHCILFTIATAFYFQQVRAKARNERDRVSVSVLTSSCQLLHSITRLLSYYSNSTRGMIPFSVTAIKPQVYIHGSTAKMRGTTSRFSPIGAANVGATTTIGNGAGSTAAKTAATSSTASSGKSVSMEKIPQKAAAVEVV